MPGVGGLVGPGSDAGRGRPGGSWLGCRAWAAWWVLARMPGVGGLVGTARRYSRRMTQWEYMTAPVLVHATKQILDNFGSDGWELVQIVPGMNPENLVAYFKRPVQA